MRAHFAAVAESEEGSLRKMIPNEQYRENFEALVAKLAPDGARVSSVDLLSASLGKTLPAVRLGPRRPVSDSRSDEPKLKQFEGEIRAADETGATNTIRLITDAGVTFTFEVREALMEDIVLPFYGQRVTLLGRELRRGSRWALVGQPELADNA